MVSLNWQILLSLKYELWWHHLKGLFLSFLENHEIVEIEPTEFKLWQLKESPTDWLNGGGVVEHLSTAITLVSLIQFQNVLDFLKLRGRPFKLCVLHWGPNLSFFGLGPWAIIHGIAKIANTFISQDELWWHHLKGLFLKLSENHKIVEIEPTEFKLWQLKESPTID